MSSCEMAALITSIACSLSKQYRQEDLALLAGIFGQLSATIAVILEFDGLHAEETGGNPDLNEEILADIIR